MIRNRSNSLVAWSRSGPTNASATLRHWPSSTCLASSRHSRQSNDRAACATTTLSSADLPAPGSPATSKFRSIIGTRTGSPNMSIPTCTGSKIDRAGPSGTVPPEVSAPRVGTVMPSFLRVIADRPQAVREQRRVHGQLVEKGRLARAGLAADQQVAVDERRRGVIEVRHLHRYGWFAVGGQQAEFRCG